MTPEKRARIVTAIAKMSSIPVAVAEDILARHWKFAMARDHERIADIAALVLDEEDHAIRSAYVETPFVRRHIAAERARLKGGAAGRALGTPRFLRQMRATRMGDVESAVDVELDDVRYTMLVRGEDVLGVGYTTDGRALAHDPSAKSYASQVARVEHLKRWWADRVASRVAGRGGASGVSQEARLAIEKALGEMGSLLDATRLLKPAGLKLIGEPRIVFFQRARAWSVDLRSVSDAPKLFASLVSKRALTASDPYLHDMPLYVPTKDGFVVVTPAEKASKAPKAPNKNDEKDALIRHVEAFFGLNSARIIGRDGDYNLALKPVGRFRGVFGATSFSAPTLSELGVKMDAAIAKARAAVGDGGAS